MARNDNGIVLGKHLNKGFQVDESEKKNKYSD